MGVTPIQKIFCKSFSNAYNGSHRKKFLENKMRLTDKSKDEIVKAAVNLAIQIQKIPKDFDQIIEKAQHLETMCNHVVEVAKCAKDPTREMPKSLLANHS